MTVRVRFDCTVPEAHLVRVTMTFPAAPARERRFRMAAWVPGSYKIRDYGRHVQDLAGRVAGKPARVEQTGKDEWTVHAAADREVELTYDVYCRELSVQGSHVTSDHAHLYPATLVLYDEHSRDAEHRVEVVRPRGWGLWSGLEGAALDGRLDPAEGYDHLIDCPIEVAPSGTIHVETFSVRNKKHRFVVWSPPDGVDWDRIRGNVRAVVAAAGDLFGGLPYKHYTFITHCAVDHGGGLEHRNSTVLGLDPLGLVADDKIQGRLLPLVAHEFFHTWNVKRILPAAFKPYDLQREVYTDLLWLFEGFTTYYELPLLYRAGVVDDKHFGKIAAEMVEFYEMAIGRKRRPVAEASRLTWSLLYQPHEHNVNRNVSYYTKGLFVGLCLDAHLRTHGVADGLDRVMRYLWENHAETGVGEADFPAIVEAATGIDCARLLGRWVNGTSELPVDQAFRDLGWKLKRDWKDADNKLALGVTFKKDSQAIERIPEDAPAHRILQPGDELVAVDGYKWSGERLTKLAAGREAGDELAITVFREGRLREFTVPLWEKPHDKFSLELRKGDAAATRRRKAWLGAASRKELPN